MLLQSTFAFRGEPVICWKRLFMCTIQWCLCFSVLDLVKRLLTKVVRMSTVKGPQPNSTSAADRNKVTKSLAWMKSTFQCPGTHSQGSPNNSSRCPNDSPRGTFQYLTLTDIFKLFASRWPRALDLMWRTLQQTSPRFSLGNKICYIHIYRHNRLRWPGSPRIWTRPVLKASEPTGATKFFESRPISYLWIIMNLTYQTSIQISQDSFSVKVSPISFHSSRLMQRILLLLYFRS